MYTEASDRSVESLFLFLVDATLFECFRDRPGWLVERMEVREGDHSQGTMLFGYWAGEASKRARIDAIQGTVREVQA